MKSGNRARLVRGAILMAWVVLIGLLLRFEAFPEYFTRTMPGYRGLLSGDVLIEDNWSRLLFNSKPIGYSHTSIETDDADPLRHYSLQNRVYVRLKAMGFDQPVYVDTAAYVDVAHALQEFSFALSSRAYRMSIKGKRSSGSNFRVHMKTGNTAQSMDVVIPDDVILYSPMTEMAMKQLRPGGELSFKSFDPASMAPSRVTVRALRIEPYKRGDHEEPVTVLATDYQGITVHSWVARDGTLLRQETPLGWTLESCTADEALATIHQGVETDDMVADLAVRVTGAIQNPRECAQVRLRLSGTELSADELDTNRQHVESATQDGLVLIVDRGAMPAVAAGEPLEKDEREATLAATPFLQATAPEMVAKAKSIVGDLTDERAQARAIFNWVHKNVRKEMTVSLPSALDVLATLSGDCNEHTYLFVALARAAGLPAKVMVGVAYNEEAFYYHAWPAVYLGTWVEMDPTWGQETVDATHIRFVEGELDQQVDIIKLVGRLRVEVLEEKSEDQIPKS